MSRSIPRVVMVLLAITVAAPAAAAEAGHDRVVKQVRVAVGDLDLSQPAGADELLRRLSVAAARACGGPPAGGVLIMQQGREYRACRRNAVERTVAGVPAPVVQQRYAQSRAGGRIKVADVRP